MRKPPLSPRSRICRLSLYKTVISIEFHIHAVLHVAPDTKISSFEIGWVHETRGCACDTVRPAYSRSIPYDAVDLRYNGWNDARRAESAPSPRQDDPPASSRLIYASIRKPSPDESPASTAHSGAASGAKATQLGPPTAPPPLRRLTSDCVLHSSIQSRIPTRLSRLVSRQRTKDLTPALPQPI